MLIDYIVVGLVALSLFGAAGMVSHFVIINMTRMLPRQVRGFFMDLYESGARWWMNFLFSFKRKVKPNRRLTSQELMEREALRRGICSECGVDTKKPGGIAGHGPCPFHF
jgi:hypothetical protein